MVNFDNVNGLSGTRKSSFANGMFDHMVKDFGGHKHSKDVKQRVEAHKQMRKIDFDHARATHEAHMTEHPEYARVMGEANLDVKKSVDKHDLKHEIKSTTVMGKVNRRQDEKRHTQTMAFGDQLNAQKIGHFGDQVAAGMRRPVGKVEKGGSAKPDAAPAAAASAQPWSRPTGASPSAVRSATRGGDSAPVRTARPDVPVPSNATAGEGLNAKQTGNFGRVSADLGDIADRLRGGPAKRAPVEQPAASPAKPERGSIPVSKPAAKPAGSSAMPLAPMGTLDDIKDLARGVQRASAPKTSMTDAAPADVRKADKLVASGPAPVRQQKANAAPADAAAPSRAESFGSGIRGQSPADMARATSHVSIAGNYARSSAYSPAAAPGDSSVKRPTGPAADPAPARGDSSVKRASSPMATPAPARGDSVVKNAPKGAADRPRSTGQVTIAGGGASSPAFTGTPGAPAPSTAPKRTPKSRVSKVRAAKASSDRPATQADSAPARPTTDRPRAVGHVNIGDGGKEGFAHGNSLIPGAGPVNNTRPGFQQRDKALVEHVQTKIRK